MTDDDVELPVTEPERPADDAVPHWWPAELDADYDLLGELGRGGMAVVFRARDRDLGREVAVKVVRPRFAADEEAVARLAREARTVAQLEHPNIVGVYSIRHLADRSVALVMQLIPGRTLKQAITEDGPFEAAAAEQVLRDIARALAYAHRAGVVHRDVKPENIFLDATSGRAMLSDFGVARVMDAPTELTATGTTIGTPTYMAPEQIDGVHLDGRSDLYSLGMVGWEMLTGERPWAGESLYSVIYRQKHDQLPAIDSLREDVPPRTQYLIEGLMPKNPDRRWASAARFLTLLASDQQLPGFKEWESAQRRRRRTRVFQQARQRGDSVIEAALETVKFSRPPTPIGPLEAARQTPSAPPPEDSERFFEPTGEAAVTVGFRSGSRTPATRQAAAAALGAGAGAVAPSTPSGGFSVHRPPHLANVRLSEEGVAVIPSASKSRLIRVGVLAVTLATLSSVIWIQFGPSRAEEVKLIGFPDVQADDRGVAVPVVPAADTSSRVAPDSVVAARPDSAVATQRPPAPVATPPNTRLSGVSPKADSARVVAPPPPSTSRTTTAGDTTTRPGVFTSPPVIPVAPVVPTLTFPRDAGRVAAGAAHSCAIESDGRAICWGRNGDGQLGDGSTVSERTTPAPVAGDFTFEQITSGNAHTCGLTSNGSIVCWGQNTSGQLGDGTAQSRTAPVGVVGTVSFRAVRAGRDHTCGVSSARNVLCWGANAEGQLGDGSRGRRSTPVLVDVPGTVAELSVGYEHTCALTSDGSAYCWGKNDYGQLGDGSGTSRTVPTKVKGDVPFVSLATGRSHTCAIASGTGEAWCWGRNNSGQLGLGGQLDSSIPRVVSGGTPFSTITAGTVFTCARGRDSSAWCWGSNNYGQLGDGTTTPRTVPAQVKGLGMRLASLSAGGAHVCAVTAANETYCWGFNVDGQIGRGDRDPTPTPVRVPGPPR